MRHYFDSHLHEEAVNGAFGFIFVEGIKLAGSVKDNYVYVCKNRYFKKHKTHDILRFFINIPYKKNLNVKLIILLRMSWVSYLF